MHKNPVITIARQFGSGGHEIGRRVAELLGIKVYDKELIQMAAEKSGYHPEVLSKVDEKAAGSLLYTLAIGASRMGGLAGNYDIPINDKLFIAQNEIIQELAEKEQCVIVGRCGDYALRHFENKFSVFIYADIPMRAARIMESRGISESEAKNLIAKEDKKRSGYYNFYTGQKWGAVERYGAAFNTAVLGIENTAKIIADIARSFS
ncbi:MAG: cytidylate kinase-like family protein [Clostridia bacterium]|nr:cytidylate kinase-like family protein [Clostridia bacterium]